MGDGRWPGERVGPPPSHPPSEPGADDPPSPGRTRLRSFAGGSGAAVPGAAGLGGGAVPGAPDAGRAADLPGPAGAPRRALPAAGQADVGPRRTPRAPQPPGPRRPPLLAAAQLHELHLSPRGDGAGAPARPPGEVRGAGWRGAGGGGRGQLPGPQERGGDARVRVRGRRKVEERSQEGGNSQAGMGGGGGKGCSQGPDGGGGGTRGEEEELRAESEGRERENTCCEGRLLTVGSLPPVPLSPCPPVPLSPCPGPGSPRTERALPGTELAEYARFIRAALGRTQGRELVPSLAEIAALSRRQELLCTVHCPGAGACSVAIDSHTTAGEVRPPSPGAPVLLCRAPLPPGLGVPRPFGPRTARPPSHAAAGR
uniref:Uncharacterized protein n=1 Tax=Ornithorhynchus anatinus TaxID=9258 RepID=A0A6I8PEB2_ORNAN